MRQHRCISSTVLAALYAATGFGQEPKQPQAAGNASKAAPRVIIDVKRGMTLDTFAEAVTKQTNNTVNIVIEAGLEKTCLPAWPLSNLAVPTALPGCNTPSAHATPAYPSNPAAWDMARERQTLAAIARTLYPSEDVDASLYDRAVVGLERVESIESFQYVD